MSAPATVVAEPMRQPRPNTLLIHLLNYDVARTPSLTNLEVRLRLRRSAAVAKVTLLSPDRAGAPVLPYQVKEGVLAFAVPRLATYDLAVVELAQSK